jgi:Ca2+-binding RTX toxin-like protein
MTSFIFSSGDHSVQSLASGEFGTLGRDAAILSYNNPGIFAGGGNIDLRINGQVLVQNSIGISMFGNGGTNLRLSIGATGVVETSGTGSTSFAAVTMWQVLSGTFVNQGWISGNGTGAYLAAIAGGQIYADNAGTIQSEYAGVQLGGAGLIKMTNSGTIHGDYGISNDYLGTVEHAMLNLTNTGIIAGQSVALRVGDQSDAIINKGTIIGDVYLNNGNDTFDNRGGTVDGSIDLGLGADWFTAGLSAETVNGGGGVDTLSFYASLTGVTVALDESIANTGAAAGDDYISFEILRGSKFGADRFIGTTANETFWGNGGADSLSGGAGVDALIGGAGIDRLSGGAGNDKFIFHSTTEVGDLISDFGNAGTNDDQILIKASGFGGGLVAGALSATQFIVRADHAAQDSNDRFIFNTVDHSLWFDRDGNGVAAAVMVADLQNTSAIMTAADILLI